MNPSIRVLYVEDNPQDADLTRSLFAGHAPEFEIEIVGTGRECLERLRETGFDLLLLDHHLPDMDGLDVMKALSDADSQVPVVLVTGVGDEELVVKALRLGAANYVPKHGAYLETLLNLVRGVVEEHRQSRSQRIPIAASRRRILYVEHLPMDIELTLRHIAEAAPHFAVDVVRTCAEALTRLEQPHAYDLALVDLRMPDLSGLDFVREAKQRRLPLPPFIMISGQGDEGAAIAALKLGARDYITKRDGYLNQLPHAIEQAIAHDRLDRVNGELRAELAERKRAAEALRENQELLTVYLRHSPICTFIKSATPTESRVLYASDSLQQLTGIPARDMVGKTMADLFPAELAAKMTADDWAVVSTGEVLTLDEDLDGRNYTSVKFPIVQGGRTLLAGYTMDITERKRAEQALRVSEERYRTLFDKSIDGIALADADTGTILDCNVALCRIVERDKAELLGQPQSTLHPPQHLVGGETPTFRQHRTGAPDESLEDEFISKSGKIVPIEVRAARLEIEGRSCLLGIFRDITERKQAEAALRVKDWAIESAISAIAISDLAGSLSYVNPAFARLWGYESAAGILGRSVAAFWLMEDKAKEIAETVRAEGGWSGDLVAQRKDGVLFDVHVSSSLVLDVTGQPVFMQASFEDITERKRAQEALRLSLEGTLSVLSHAAEMRDPYTAGHQRRVTALAVAIARELGCSDDEYNALRIAGLLHDIGKLGIPAEILSKPSQLSAIEFKLVREHSQTGYDILADVPFPGPVAEIVFQHHERLDGSGYPRALTGDQILHEARILAVADVVEAMASHRPYRPALGIAAALDEIRAGSGTRYDQQIVDACVALFESGEFSFQPASAD